MGRPVLALAGPFTLCATARGETLRNIKEALLTLFEVVAYGALLLLLPCVVAGLIFDSILSDILAQIMLVAVAGTAILTAIAIHEGWYFEHLSGWGLTRNRVEPSLRAEPRTAEDVQPSDRAK
jgi:hypothetical protein